MLDGTSPWPDLDLGLGLPPVDPWHADVDWSQVVTLALDELQDEADLEAKQALWRADPAIWARDRVNTFLWSKQREIAESVRDNPKTVVPSCHAAGKSKTAAVVATWWLDTHPAGTAFVLTTAPTFAQVRAILWREIRVLHKQMDPPLGRVNQTEWLIDEELVAFGRKPADHDEAAFQGIHDRYVLLILDEAGGVPEQLWIAADSIATNDDARILAIGNPDDATSHFAKVCDLPGWNVIRIPADATPNLTGEDVPDELRMLLISAAWVAEKKLEWGEDNPIYIAKILAEFPVDATDKVVRASDVARCRIGRDEPHPPSALLPVELGMDIGGGIDDTVIRERRGLKAGRRWSEKTDDPERIAEMLVAAVKATGARHVKYDAVGIGWSVGAVCARALRDAGIRGVKLTPINFGEGAKKREKYKNRRAEVWWEVGRLLSQDGGWDLSGMQDADKTLAQLCDPKWSTDAAGRIVVEAKDEIRKRTGRSPDDADALLLSFCSEGGPAHIASAEKTGARLPTRGHAGTPVGVRRIGPIPGGGR